MTHPRSDQPQEISRRRFHRLTVAALAGGLGAAAVPAAGRGQWKPGTIIDSHVHLKHGDAARTEYSPEVIVATMDNAGIHKSIVFAMGVSTARSIAMAKDAVERFPDRLVPYLYAVPHFERPVAREIEEALGGGLFRGIKLHGGAECTFWGDTYDPVFPLAAKHRAPCLIDFAGNDRPAERVAKMFPDAVLLIAHMGQYLCQDKARLDRFIALAERYENVYLDVSGVVLTEKIEEAVQRIGSQKVVWGTDGPDKKPDEATFAQAELDKILRLKRCESDKEDILGRNILRLIHRGQ